MINNYFYLLVSFIFSFVLTAQSYDDLRDRFVSPPDEARPGVYWYFMDGNMSHKAITDDLESMKKVGIGTVLFLEVNLGYPRYTADFFSAEWQKNFKHIISECERLNIRLTMGIGPGWTGSGGPWVKPEESMRLLISSEIHIIGGKVQKIVLPKPTPPAPYFGSDVFTPELRKLWENYYEDVIVLAFPTVERGYLIPDFGEKALFYRHPYTSRPNTLATIPEPDPNKLVPDNQMVQPDKVIELTHLLKFDGSITWKVPNGNWTIMRMGMCNNGAITRPAPIAGLGFESDKFDTSAFKHHFDNFIGVLLRNSDFTAKQKFGGFTTLHMDSWEMGTSNWGNNFRAEFNARRGYDPAIYLPVLSGKVVDSPEISERFLWDLRYTAMELVLANHAGYVKTLAHRHGLDLSIEPYDMNPCSDLDLGAVADVPGCEFWNYGKGFPSAFSCIEATSIAHVLGKPVVMAEAFTSMWNQERYIDYPATIKNQGDWAFCMGINYFYYHTFAHKGWLNEKALPGMAMAGYGIHWDRGQTWWNMSGAYHKYIARCSYLLRQGKNVSDILYLSAEGAPCVFRAPASAVDGPPDTLPDKKGFGFDACSPLMLLNQGVHVNHGNIVFPDGGSYKIMILPLIKSMTPPLLAKLKQLVADGATIIGTPPLRSNGLQNYPAWDDEIVKIVTELWGSTDIPAAINMRRFGKGKIYWGGMMSTADSASLYPAYRAAEHVLKEMGLTEDFISNGKVRYGHHVTETHDIWFVSNRTNEKFKTSCTFRCNTGAAEVWDPVTGEMFATNCQRNDNGTISINLPFDAYQSYFLITGRNKNDIAKSNNLRLLNDSLILKQSLIAPWEVFFDTLWKGPGKVTFANLDDWSKRPEPGIKYYSGTAVYKTKFSYSSKIKKNARVFLDLGDVYNMARVKLNGNDLGVVWTVPWRVNITGALIRGLNQLEIEVVNSWTNRMIGDEELPYDAIEEGVWPDWLTRGILRTSGRCTFSPWTIYQKGESLQKSGLLGTVTILREE